MLTHPVEKAARWRKPLRNWPLLGSTFFVVLLAFQATVDGDDTSRPAQPVCALVDTAKLPMTGVLEASLLADSSATWVERTEVARVIAEQELQASFGATATRERAALGRLLKADVLVLLRTVKNPAQQGPALIECVVCETRQGLRLKSVAVSVDDDEEAAAESLKSAVNHGIRKFNENIETVVAVPPFMSDDLGFTQNYLQSAYARLVEQTLLDQPGLLVVEINEAQAIVRELAINPTEKALLDRRSPLYLVGRYRHDRMDGERTLRISLRLLQNDKQLALKGVRDMAPAEGPAWIRTRTEELLPALNLAGTAQAPESPDSGWDAKNLGDRGQQFQKVGSWAEALSLYEASLLIDPNQPELRRNAVIVTTPLIRTLWSIDGKIPDDETIAESVALHDRALQHLEEFMEVAPPWKVGRETDAYFGFIRDFFWRLPSELLGSHHRADAPPKLIAQLRRNRTETLLRIGRKRADAGIERNELEKWEVWAIERSPEAERYSTILRIAEEWKDLPDLSDRLVDMTFRSFLGVEETPEYKSFIDKLAKLDSAAAQEALRSIGKRQEKAIAFKAEMENKRAPDEVTDIDPRLVEVKPEIVNVPGDLYFEGGIEAGANRTVLWRNRYVCLLRPPGRLEPLYVHPELNLHMQSVVFDGRYVWIAGHQTQKPMTVIAVDIESKRSFEFFGKDGLPFVEGEQATAGRRHALQLGAVAEGKACLAGYTGHSWIAELTITPEGKKSVDVFFEARETESATDRSQATNPKVVFDPAFAVRLSEPGSTDCRILVGRNSSSLAVAERPLLIDPSQKTVTIAPFKLYGDVDPRLMVVGKGTLFILKNNYPDYPHVMRISFPGDQEVELIAKSPQGHVGFDERGLHILGKEWWLADPDTGDIKSVSQKLPWYYSPHFFTPGQKTNPDFGVPLQKTTRLGILIPSSEFGVLAHVKKGRSHYLMRLDLDSPTGDTLPQQE